MRTDRFCKRFSWRLVLQEGGQVLLHNLNFCDFGYILLSRNGILAAADSPLRLNRPHCGGLLFDHLSLAFEFFQLFLNYLDTLFSHFRTSTVVDSLTRASI